ncbi:MAG TPA: hypothetical protein PJ993_00800 [Candidatus Saccharibacteria bacterium]|nr:hypothetical protein [Candidatus Saccharibacteria bacterium]HMT39463.1 hypothetical protein [Candidatus Saccharibacteria bacterium]
MKPKELKTLNDFIKYWQDLIKDLNSKNESKISADMIRASSSPNFGKYNEGDEYSKIFSDIFDMLVQIDRRDTPQYFRDAQWQLVKANLKLLKEQQS